MEAAGDKAALNLMARGHQRRIAFCTWCAWVFVVLGFVVGVAALGPLRDKGGGMSLDNLAAYGNFLQGAVSSLWSLAGLMFIYAAFLAQKQQLIQQEAELEDQKRQFQIQNESISRQGFESSFFQLLRLRNQIAGEMRSNGASKTVGGGHQAVRLEGRECFAQWHRELKSAYCSRLPTQRQSGDRAFVTECYLEVYRPNQGELGHYFRTLYHTIKFVNLSDIKDKRRYITLARAQLSQYELALLFYNCASPLGEKFKPLVEEFGLLENLDDALLLDPGHKEFYAPSAYR
jgi:hypothetical protein